MFDFYDLKIVSTIMETFKVTDIVISGLSNKEILSEVLNYCNTNNSSYIAIDSKESNFENYINDYPLNILQNLNNYGAIFLNDDPNWYTVYNELNIIKNNNNEFPLVFICHNIFPHKRRDSYINPNCIPKEFLNEYSKKIKLNDEFYIEDEFFHAINENTYKNGVLTAIEDFLKENASIKIMDIKLLNGITILYPNTTISTIRIGKLKEITGEHQLNQNDLYNEFVENQCINNYIRKGNLSSTNNIQDKLNKKNKVIEEYEYQIKYNENELRYKSSQITNLDSQLSLKDSQIKNIESKLTNKENEIAQLNSKLKQSNTQVTSLNNELELNKRNYKNSEEKLKNEIKNTALHINSLEKEFSKKENELNNNIKRNNEEIMGLKKELTNKGLEIKEKEMTLNSMQKQYTNQFSKLENKEYCITCLKEENENNHLEIQYLKKNNFTKKILTPFGYLYLMMKCNIKELSTNFKLYKVLKNSKCFDTGYYLNKNKDLQESKWCNYFSPELHYVCKGFDEKREFNKKYYNKNSKKELLEYILNNN